eukprot:5799666-Pyramimonas_sp.AAC.1
MGYLPKVRPIPGRFRCPRPAPKASTLGRSKGSDTATPRTSPPGVRSGQNFEANPAVATREAQEAEKGEGERRAE